MTAIVLWEYLHDTRGFGVIMLIAIVIAIILIHNRRNRKIYNLPPEIELSFAVNNALLMKAKRYGQIGDAMFKRVCCMFMIEIVCRGSGRARSGCTKIRVGACEIMAAGGGAYEVMVGRMR